jgi:AAA ATPase central domain protein
MIAKILFDLGYIKENKVIETSRQDFVAEYAGQTAPKTTATVEKAMGGVLFIDEAYSLKLGQIDSYGDEAISTLIKLMEDYKNDLVVIFAGYSKEMQEFIHANSGIKSRIGYTFEFADYSVDELYKIFELKMNAINFTIDEKGKQYVMNLLSAGKKKKDFGNGRFVDNALQKILIKHSSIEKLSDKNVTKLTKDSIPTLDEVMAYSSGVREPEKIEELFDDIIGMNALKEQIIGLGKYIKFKKEVNKTDGKNLPDMNLHMMFLGNPGTGKTTIARKVTKMLYDLDCIRINKLVEVSRQDLIGEYSGETAPKVEKVIESAMGGVLFVDEAYSLKLSNNDQLGSEAIATLIKCMEDNKDELVVIFAGYTKEMQEFIHENSGIKSRIGYTIEFADYSEDELYEILKLKVNKIGFEIDKKIIPNIMEILKFGKHKRDFGNGRFVDNLLTSMLKKHSMNYKKENIFIIGEQDIPSIDELMGETSGERNPEKIEELFDDIFGMDKIKEQVIQLGKYIKFQEELSKITAKRLPDMRLHMLFTGDAGTGKTTMARKITQMLYNLGIIRINKLIEVDRKDLVAEYIGQTAPKTQRVIEGALGGVLFIDEAYSLSPKDSLNDLGKEAIATLIKAMEDNRDDLVVIFAGYTKEMKDFVNSNSGIASRIGYTFEFENYKDEELYKIFEIKCKEYDLIIKLDVKEKIMEVFKYFSSVENFGNGRFVDKILQEILVKHSMNKNLMKNINTLMVDDIPTIKEMVEKTFNNRDNLVIPSDVSMEDRRKIAIHELGHAIIHYIYRGETNLKVITVIPEGTGTLGYVLHTIPKSKVIWTKRDYLDEIEELIAGRAAEEVFLGKDKVGSGCWNDLDKVANIIDNIFKDTGMSETLGLISAKNIKPSLEMQQKLDQEKKETLDSCYENVKNVIKTNKEMFDKVLDVLMEKGTLTGEEFVKLVKAK